MTQSNFRETIFIGDVHGQAPTLLALLDTLGCRKRSGQLRAPAGSRLVFVGDLIDRGPANRQTIETVRELVETGDALCLLGNHEYNAVQFHTPDPEAPGEYLRRHTPKNLKQHRAFQCEFRNDPAGLAETIAWFRTLPLAMEQDGWRCVHACWDDDLLARFQRRGSSWHIPDDAWVAAARKGSPQHRAIEIIAKGPEMLLPPGAHFTDKDGHVRRAARLQWWRPRPKTMREGLLFPVRPTGISLDAPYDGPPIQGYGEDAPLVFFGHYWKRGKLEAERPNAACLDYSAGKGDRLVAYRFRGETRLEPEHFVAQPVVQEVRS